MFRSFISLFSKLVAYRYEREVHLLPSVRRVLPPSATRVKEGGSEAAREAATKETVVRKNFIVYWKDSDFEWLMSFRWQMLSIYKSR